MTTKEEDRMDEERGARKRDTPTDRLEAFLAEHAFCGGTGPDEKDNLDELVSNFRENGFDLDRLVVISIRCSGCGATCSESMSLMEAIGGFDPDALTDAEGWTRRKLEFVLKHGATGSN
jgi:hypothetical protein